MQVHTERLYKSTTDVNIIITDSYPESEYILRRAAWLVRQRFCLMIYSLSTVLGFDVKPGLKCRSALHSVTNRKDYCYNLLCYVKSKLVQNIAFACMHCNDTYRPSALFSNSQYQLGSSTTTCRQLTGQQLR